MTVDRPKPKSAWRRIERWLVGIVMALIAFVLEKIVLRGIRKAGREQADKGELHTTLTSKGGEVDLEDPV